MDEPSESTALKKSKWEYCPVCGAEVLKSSRKVRFCMGCGLDLVYAEEKKELPPDYQPKMISRQEMYLLHVSRPKREKIDETEILEKRDTKLWGLGPTFGMTAIGYVAMTMAAVVLLMPLVLFSFGNLNSIYTPEVLIISSLAEFGLIVVPLIYVGRYLEQPTVKNRLVLLGFSSREYNEWGVLKEFLIGISFAFIGIVLVYLSSLGIELFVKYVFGVEIIYSGGDIESFLSSADAVSISLIALTMIFVVGTSEEILFRGFMQKGLMRSNLGVKKGIIINALIFTFIHIFTVFMYITENPLVFISIFLVYFIPYFVISLMLSYLFYWRKENLIAVMIAHGLYDAITLIIVFIFMGL